MSLILEALRRSEAERQRGRAPGLFVEQQGLRRERRVMPAWAFWAAGAVLVAVLLAWAWRETMRDEPGRGMVPTAATPAEPAPVGSAEPAPAASSEAVPDATASTASSLPAPGFPPTPDPALVAEPAPAAEPEPVATVDTADAEATTAIATPTGPLPTAAPEPLPAPPPAPAASAEEVLPRLADIPAGERGGLPPLKLSMHVYSDDPVRRFVIVDGQRLTEGAAPAPGVVVEAIRRDGAVLSLNGRRVLLGRP